MEIKTLGNFADLVGRSGEAAGTPILGTGAKVRLENSFKNTPSAFITDNCVTGWTLELMDTCD